MLKRIIAIALVLLFVLVLLPDAVKIKTAEVFYRI